MRFWKWLGGWVCRWRGHEWRQAWKRKAGDALLSGTVTKYRCRRCSAARTDWSPSLDPGR